MSRGRAEGELPPDVPGTVRTMSPGRFGQIACGSCHVDARLDALAWDLGDPSGAMRAVTGNNLGANVPGLNTGFQPFHPMKGPMTTQTLQDIVGKEPLHWRGDRSGLEEFNGAFLSLQGDDANLTPAEMQQFEASLGTGKYGDDEPELAKLIPEKIREWEAEWGWPRASGSSMLSTVRRMWPRARYSPVVRV